MGLRKLRNKGYYKQILPQLWAVKARVKNMKEDKKQLSVIIYAIILLTFNAIFFPWFCLIGWVFSVISIAAGAGIAIYAFRNSDDLKSKVYGFPILRIAMMYPVIQIVFTFIICIIGLLANVPDCPKISDTAIPYLLMN